jgi:hypothetical protein
VLIVGLTIVQIGTAFVENVSKRFDKGMPRALDLDYKGHSISSLVDNVLDFTDPAVDLTNCTKPTNV